MIARFSPAAMRRHVRNLHAIALMDRVMSKPWGMGRADDACRALEHARLGMLGAGTATMTKNKALKILGKLMSPSEQPGYIEAIIRLRQAIVSINLDTDDHVVHVDEATRRLDEALVAFPEDQRPALQRAKNLLAKLWDAKVSEVHYGHLCQVAQTSTWGAP